jgi:hypothetical protein
VDFTVANQTATLPAGVYTLILIDTHGDGLGSGGYVATVDGAHLFSGSFGSGRFFLHNHTFTIGTPVPAAGSNQSVQVVVQHDELRSDRGWILFGASNSYTPTTTTTTIDSDHRSLTNTRQPTRRSDSTTNNNDDHKGTSHIKNPDFDRRGKLRNRSRSSSLENMLGIIPPRSRSGDLTPLTRTSGGVTNGGIRRGRTRQPSTTTNSISSSFVQQMSIITQVSQ